MTTGNSFWTEGATEHSKALKESEARELEALNERLKRSSPAEVAEIEAEIQRVRHEYKEQQRQAKVCLFLAPS